MDLSILENLALYKRIIQIEAVRDNGNYFVDFKINFLDNLKVKVFFLIEILIFNTRFETIQKFFDENDINQLDTMLNWMLKSQQSFLIYLIYYFQIVYLFCIVIVNTVNTTNCYKLLHIQIIESIFTVNLQDKDG